MRTSLIPLLFVACLLAGCAGGMSGKIVGTNEKVSVRYVQEGSLSGTLEISLPDGEVFKGPYSKAESEEGLRFALQTGFAPNIKGSLVSTKGRKMTCWIAVTDRALGLSTGGRGVGILEDGTIIELSRF
jgi:hypothetical protein